MLAVKAKLRPTRHGGKSHTARDGSMAYPKNFARHAINTVAGMMVLGGQLVGSFDLVNAAEPSWKQSAAKKGDVRLVQFESNDNGEDLQSVLDKKSGKNSNPVTSAFKKAGSSIQGFFTSSPSEPVVENDPISLSSMPDSIGAEVYLGAARMLEKNGNYAGAEKQYQGCLEKYPDNRTALISYGRLLHHLKRMQDSVTIYDEALKRYPEDAVILNDRGLCLARMGQHDAAMESIHRATVIDGKNVRYRNNMAMVLVDVGRIDEALSQLQYAHGPAGGYYNLGHLLNRKGDEAGAMRAFQLALEAEPSLEPARQMIARLSAAGQPNLVEQRQVPPRPQAMFIGDQPRNSVTRPMAPQGNIPPAPESNVPQLLPPVR